MPGEKEIRPAAGDALVVVDVQNDFLPGGALGVPGGDRIIVPLNNVIRIFSRAALPLFFTRDWHPRDHCSFRENGGPWPAHCVQHTRGAEFSDMLTIPENAFIVSKATSSGEEQYSTIQGRTIEGDPLGERLRRLEVQRIFIGGLATDYCVLNTVIDARVLGFEVFVLTDAIQAVNVNPEDGEKALHTMQDRGARFIRSQDITG
jgi:nicotinamidase/pyrazinamidase